MKKKICFSKLIQFITVILFLLGIAGIFYAVNSSKEEKTNEHFDHLLDLAYAVDHNLDSVLDRCYADLNECVEDDECTKAFNEAVLSGDTSSLKKKMANLNILKAPFVSDMVIVKKGQALSVFEKDLSDSDFSFVKEHSIWAKEDSENEKVYIYISSLNKEEDLAYILILDFDEFYKRVVVNEIYAEYWIVIYSSNGGLTLQNDDDQPQYRILSEEDVMARNDGFTEILKAEKNKKISRMAYDFVEEETGDYYSCKMSILPITLSENGLFSIGVASFDSNIIGSIDIWTSTIIIAAFLIASSLTIVIYSLINSGKERSRQEKEIAVLEKENDLLEEKNRLICEMEHHKRLETIGTITAGISHEFNNLLSPIMSESLLALENTAEDSKVYNNLIAIYQSSEKARELVKRISRISRKRNETEMHPMSVNALFENVISMMSSTIPKNIKVLKQISMDVIINGDETQLEYMLINLINNAVHAIGDKKGEIILSLTVEEEYALISVKDNGPGIKEELLETIFDPFYTTKEVGKGTGLGLSIARNIALEHNGTLKARNLASGGACFDFKVAIFKNEA